MIQLLTLPNFWKKKTFTIYITPAKPTKLISTEKYTELVNSSLERWKSVLSKFSKNNDSNVLSEIEFNVISDSKKEVDIRIQWWFSRFQVNGLTEFQPTTGEVKNAIVWISKCTGPEIFSLERPVETYSGTPVIRRPEQIESAITHEFGHILGLGHCNFQKDLMFTNSENQPDPKRRISNLDLKIINGLLDETNSDFILGNEYNFDETDWKSTE